MLLAHAYSIKERAAFAKDGRGLHFFPQYSPASYLPLKTPAEASRASPSLRSRCGPAPKQTINQSIVCVEQHLAKSLHASDCQGLRNEQPSGYGWRSRKNSFETAGLVNGTASCVLVSEPGTSYQSALTPTLTALV